MVCRDRIALVTGATSGIGLSTALTLAREGAKIAICYNKNKESAVQLDSHIKSNGGDSIVVQCDVLKNESVDRLVDTVMDKYGRIEICIINPGAGWHPESIHELDYDGAIQDIVSEISPVYSFFKKVLPLMYSKSWGRIISMGTNPTDMSPSFAYNVAKLARHQALLSAAKSAWKNGRVTINTVAPVYLIKAKTFEEAVEFSNHGPLWQNRIGLTTQDIAEGIAFLCSENARFITGTILPYTTSH